MPSSRLALPTSASSPALSSSKEHVIATAPQYDRNNGDNFGGNFAGSLLLHGLAFAAIFGWAFLFRAHNNWGENASSVGAIQATMVASLPLPPKQPTNDNNVLTSETPSPAPIQNKEQTQPPPKPDELAIPDKFKKPPKTAEKAAPAPPKHIQQTPPQTKAASGETSGMRIAESTTDVRNGTASVSVEDRTFGARFAYYIKIVNTKVAQNWYTGEADPRTSNGRSVTLVFDIDRSGAPSNVRIETPSGSPTLDQSAVHAVQRVDGFGPLPQGNQITVEYTFHLHLQ
jgi:protein TonB